MPSNVSRKSLGCSVGLSAFEHGRPRNSRMTVSISSWTRPFEATRCAAAASNGDPSMPGDAAARLLDDQRAGGDVPRLEVLFPERVEAAGRDVAQIERRRPEPAHRARAAEERAEQRRRDRRSADARRTESR